MKKIMFLFALVYSGLLCSVEHSDPFYRDLLILQTENSALREENAMLREANRMYLEANTALRDINATIKEANEMFQDALEELQENYDFCQIQLRMVTPSPVMLAPQSDPELEDEVDEE